MYFIKYVVLVLTCMMECKSIEAAALPSSTEGQSIVNEITPIFENEHDGTSKGVTWTLVRQILQSVPVSEREEISSSLSGEPLSQLDLSEVDNSSGEEVAGLDSQEALQVHPSEDLEEISNDIFEMIPKDRLHSDDQGRLISIDSNTIGNHTNFSFMHSNVVYWNDSHDISTEEISDVLNEFSLTQSDSSEEISSDIEERSTVQAKEHPKGQEEEQFMRTSEEHTSSEAVDRLMAKSEEHPWSLGADHPKGKVEQQPSSESVDRTTEKAEEQLSSEAVDHTTGKVEEQPSSKEVDPTANVGEQPSSEEVDHPAENAEEHPANEAVNHQMGEADAHPSSESAEQLANGLVADNQRNETVNISQSTELLHEFQGSVTTSDYSKDDFVGKISSNIPENNSLHEFNNSSNTVIKSNSSFSSELSSDSGSSQSTENKLQNTQNSELSEIKNDTLTSTLVDKETVVINNDLIVSLPEVTVNHTEHLIQDEATEAISTDKSSTVPQCPESGLCLFWFLALDTCSTDNHCLGSRICCKVRCSNTCVEI